jgi:hypothetical protein
MPRTFYCDGSYRDLSLPHRWTVESSPLPLDHKNLFVQCPDHDGLTNAEGVDHARIQHFPLLPR